MLRHVTHYYFINFIKGLFPLASEAHCGYTSLHKYVITIMYYSSQLEVWSQGTKNICQNYYQCFRSLLALIWLGYLELQTEAPAWWHSCWCCWWSHCCWRWIQHSLDYQHSTIGSFLVNLYSGCSRFHPDKSLTQNNLNKRNYKITCRP